MTFLLRRRRLLAVLLGLGLFAPPAALVAVAQRDPRPPTTAPAPATAGTYTNPLPIKMGDPSVLLHDGTYYLYATSDPGEGFKVWTSPNLADWTERGHAFRKTEDSWGNGNFWAPEVIEHGGDFYLFYNATGPATPGRWGDEHRICVAKSDSPLGPFEDVAAPLWNPGHAVIDAYPFVDDDGFAYLYYSRDISQNPTSDIYVVPLRDDLLGVAGEPRSAVSPQGHQAQAWEGGEWNEGAYVMRYDDGEGDPVYLMTYSAGGFFRPEYAVGYARARDPLGPWIKASENPVLSKKELGDATVSGPGHNTFAPSPDGEELFIVYHAHTKPTGGDERDLSIDRVEIDRGDDGKVRLRVLGPTKGTPQPLPSGARPVARAEPKEDK